MFCRKCGVKLADGAAFCNHCGTPVTRQQNDTRSYQNQMDDTMGRVIIQQIIDSREYLVAMKRRRGDMLQQFFTV